MGTYIWIKMLWKHSAECMRIRTRTQSLHSISTFKCYGSLLADFSSSHINVNANLYFLNGLHEFQSTLIRLFVWRNNIAPLPAVLIATLPLMLATRHNTAQHNSKCSSQSNFWSWHHSYKRQIKRAWKLTRKRLTATMTTTTAGAACNFCMQTIVIVVVTLAVTMAYNSYNHGKSNRV